ncbi:MAG: hypothetical protein IPI75_17165 [Gammaproteobacteria bacterium]|nr:hypothetical protein [Gammaproteobacteria bacterium]
MSILQLAQKELRRRRLSTVVAFCVTSLLLLVAAALYPRNYTSSAEVRFEVAPPLLEEVSNRVREYLGANVNDPDGQLVTNLSGALLHADFSASSAQQAFAGMNALLVGLIRDETELLRSGLRAKEQALLTDLRGSEKRLAEAGDRLNQAIAELPEGGESAHGARLGQLQGEMDTLALEIRENNDLQKLLGARLEDVRKQQAALRPALDAPGAIERKIVTLRAQLTALRAGGSPDVGRVESMEAEIGRLDVELAAAQDERARVQARIERELKPQQAEIDARLASLRNELSVREKRRKDLTTMLSTARSETAGLQQTNQQIRALQNEYDTSAALAQQLKVRLQEARMELEMRTTPAQLPFQIVTPPVMPGRPDGLPAWAFVLAALVGGLFVALIRLLGAILVDDKVRAPGAIVTDVEVAVLALIPAYHPPQAAGEVRWRVMLVALLVACTLIAHIGFTVVFG